MKVLDRLPIAEEHFLLNVHGERLRLRPFQIIMQVSISPFRPWDSRTPVIPALFDSGNNHNFSIQEHHLRRWAGIHPESLTFSRKIREAGRTPSLRSASIWIHRNRAGSRELSDREPFLLHLPEGIAIYPSDGSNYPRLPLLGLRAIIRNELKLVLEGKWKYASIKSPWWPSATGQARW
jgi:hypothetical protein